MNSWIMYLHPTMFVKPWYLIGSAVGTCLVVMGLFFYRTRVFQSSDLKPEILHRIPQKGSSLENAITDVTVGLYIKTFPAFNILKNTFTIDAIVWFTFDPTALTLNAVGEFSFDKGTLGEKQLTSVKEIGELLFVEYLVRLEFSSNIDHTFYPLNDHKLYIMLLNEQLSADDVHFISSRSGFLLSQECYTHGWLVVDRAVETGYIRFAVDKYDARKQVTHPVAVFTLAVTQMNLRNTSVIFVPLFLVYCISILAVMLDPKTDSSSIMRIATSTVAAMLGYRFVIEKMSPEVSYFTLTDYLYTILVSNTFILFIYNIYSLYLGQWNPVLELFAGILVIVLNVSTIIATWYLLYWWKGNPVGRGRLRMQS